MAGVKGRSGGKRTGAGRPFKTEGCATKVMRVQSYMKETIETLIRVQAEWLSEDEEGSSRIWRLLYPMRRAGWPEPTDRRWRRKRTKGS